MSETPYTETEALLAILNEDDDRADDLIKAMHAFERINLAKAAQLLASMCTSRCAVCDDFIPAGSPSTATYVGGFPGGQRVLHHTDCPLPRTPPRRAALADSEAPA